MRILYLRTDFAIGLKAGGSVAHISGVANAMTKLGHSVVFVSTSLVPGRTKGTTTLIKPGLLRYLIFGIGNYLYNWLAWPAAAAAVGRAQPALIYHRYSLLSFLAVRLQKRFRLPLLLEYNGSEVWVATHWRIPVISLKLVAAVERRCLSAATAVIVVSQALKDQLVRDGYPPSKILVNPNGADIERYRPGRLSEAARRRRKRQLGLPADCLVIGFVGTFGQWHGVTEIVKAATVLQQKKQLPDHWRFLLVGDGLLMAEVKRLITEAGLTDRFVLPGLVPQAAAVDYLSLFDIALNPTVPNQDGSEFFGSPTKLFEYMALGLPIISSRLGQMKTLLRHRQTAWLYPPTDRTGLAKAIAGLAADPKLAAELGVNARAEAVERYSWEANVERSLAMLQQ